MTGRHVCTTYKALLTAARDVPSYNYRNFFIRKIREQFRSNKDLTDRKEIAKLLLKAQEDILMIQRTSAIGHFYEPQKIVVEKKSE